MKKQIVISKFKSEKSKKNKHKNCILKKEKKKTLKQALCVLHDFE